MRLMGRMAFLILVSGLLFALLPNMDSYAQGTTCYGLAAADCKIITTADSKIDQEKTFKQDFDLSLSINSPDQTQSITAKGSGLAALDPAGMAAAGNDTAAVLNSLKMTLSIDGALKISSRTSNVNQAGKANLVLLDGKIYEQVTGANGKLDAWQGQTIASLMNTGSDAVTTANESNAAVLAIFNDPEVLKAFAAIPTIKGFISLKKTANAPTLDGQKQIEFVYTFDILTLIKAKEMYPVLRAFASAGGSDASKLTNQQMAQVAQLVANVFKNTTFKVTRWIGTKDNLYHALVFDSVFNVNTSVLGQIGQKSDSNAVGLIGQTTIKLHFGVRLTAVGKPVDIQAPEGVTVP